MFPTHIIRDATKVLCMTNWNQSHFDAFQRYESQSFLVEIQLRCLIVIPVRVALTTCFPELKQTHQTQT